MAEEQFSQVDPAVGFAVEARRERLAYLTHVRSVRDDLVRLARRRPALQQLFTVHDRAAASEGATVESVRQAVVQVAHAPSQGNPVERLAAASFLSERYQVAPGQNGRELQGLLTWRQSVKQARKAASDGRTLAHLELQLATRTASLSAPPTQESQIMIDRDTFSPLPVTTEEQRVRLGFLRRMEESRQWLSRLTVQAPHLGALLEAHDQAMLHPEASLWSVYSEVRAAVDVDDPVLDRAAELALGQTYTPEWGPQHPLPATWHHCHKVAAFELAEVVALQELEAELTQRADAANEQAQVAERAPRLEPDTAPQHQSQTEPVQQAPSPAGAEWVADASAAQQAPPLPREVAYQELQQRAANLVESGWMTEEQAEQVVRAWQTSAAFGATPTWQHIHAEVEALDIEPVAAKYLTTVADDHVGMGPALDWAGCEQHELERTQYGAPLPAPDMHAQATPAQTMAIAR